MFGARRIRDHKPSAYATKADFCQIFEKDMNRLYLLSFLLTGDEAMAEQCFVGGLHIAQEGNLVFKEWAESWARRTITLNAIRMVRPRPTSETTPVALGHARYNGANERPEIAQIIELPVFERFAFVMSVLEGNSDHECSLHLNCTVGDIRAARTRALERIGRSAELHRKLVTIDSGQSTFNPGSGSNLPLETVPSLAASA